MAGQRQAIASGFVQFDQHLQQSAKSPNKLFQRGANSR